MTKTPPRQVPDCFVCKRPVDWMGRVKMMSTGEVEYIAACHGQRETVRVPLELLVDSGDGGGVRITLGMAFMPVAALPPVVRGLPPEPPTAVVFVRVTASRPGPGSDDERLEPGKYQVRHYHPWTEGWVQLRPEGHVRSYICRIESLDGTRLPDGMNLWPREVDRVRFNFEGGSFPR